MKHFLKSIIILQILNFHVVNGQVRTNLNNDITISNAGKFNRTYKQQIDYIIPAKNINALVQAEQIETKDSIQAKPFKLATPVAVDLDIAKLMNWDFDLGFAFGKFTIKMEDALSASLNFDKFYLPKGTEMYIYNENGSMITGPVTENENNPNKVWGSWVYKGGVINIEIKTPLATIKELMLHSNNIAYGYKEIYKPKAGGFGNSGPCEINVLCPLGNGWEAERNSVAIILDANGQSLCSGSMIMNTCNSSRPFFLTANHCYATNPVQDVSRWRFNFQDWSPVCIPSENADGVTYNGSTLRANWTNSDFCLVELINTPPANSGINYTGWTTSATPAQNATGIHHPQGDVMKISRDNNTITVASAFGQTNMHWRVDWSPQINGLGQIVTPVTEGGSSGSPIFDQNHRVVGQLQGGPSTCGGTALRDYYGRFDLSCTGGGTNSTRLSNWLDPNNTGAITTNTTSIANLVSAQLSISGGSDAICNSTPVTYTLIAPPGLNVGWGISNTSIASLSTNGYQATITKLGGNGTVILTATINGNNCFTNNPVSRSIYVGDPTTAVGIVQYNNMTTCDDIDFQVFPSNPPGFYQYSGDITVNDVTGLATSITWNLPPGGSSNGWAWVPNGSGMVTVSSKRANSFFSLRATVSNPCGSVYKDFLFTTGTIPPCARPVHLPGKKEILSISPNPATNTIKINLKTEDKNSFIREVVIANKMGIEVRHFQFSAISKTETVNIENLSPDFYIVRIFDGNLWGSLPLIKK